MNDYDYDEKQDAGFSRHGDAITEMEYMRAFHFISGNPTWFSSLIMAGLCMLIPVIGPIVIAGYMFIIVEQFHHKKNDTSYPAFEFGLFADYLSRGVWVFIVQLIFSVIIMPVMMVFQIFIMAAMGEPGGNEEAFIFAILGMYVTIIVLSIGIHIFMIPFILRAGLSQDFKTSFDFQWAKDFLLTMWKEVILSILVIFIGGTIIGLLGYAACCIGIIPAMVTITLVQHHLYWQMYEVYLSRGGQPIPLKEKVIYEDEYE